MAIGLVFVSCSSVPFESKVERHNILEEYFAIAKTYKDLENYKKAIEYYEKVLGDEEFHDFAFYEIAVCNVYLKNWNEAKTSFEQLLERDPSNSTLKLSLAYIEAMRGNLEDAQTMYDEIVQEYPHDVEPLKNLIAVLIAAGDAQTASQKLALLEENFPDESTIPEMKKKIEEAQKAAANEEDAQNTQGAKDDSSNDASNAARSEAKTPTADQANETQEDTVE